MESTKEIIKIGNASAFWGDQPSAPKNLVDQVSDLDYLTLDYLSEVSMSIMAIQKEKDPLLGYARDFVDVISSLIPAWKRGHGFKVISNCGGLNPLGCAKACAEKLLEGGLQGKRIAVVSGDDVLSLFKSASEDQYKNMETQKSIGTVQKELVTANAYFGAASIVEALEKGADIVITGRLADPSLALAPCIYHFKWKNVDYDLLASGTIAGHLIECGTQVSGGFSTDWLQQENPANIGFPVIEMHADGTFVVTKPKGTGGSVTVETVTEQLLYEIGDPDNYISPDVTVSFLSLELTEIEKNRIEIKGAKGKPATPFYKVSATYRDGYKTEGLITVFGPQCRQKAIKCGEIVLERVKQAGYEIEESRIECLGTGDVVPGIHSPFNAPETVLRICVKDSRKEALEAFSKQIAPLVTSGPQGITGYTSSRAHVRPVFAFWPALIEKKEAPPKVDVFTVEELVK